MASGSYQFIYTVSDGGDGTFFDGNETLGSQVAGPFTVEPTDLGVLDTAGETLTIGGFLTDPAAIYTGFTTPDGTTGFVVQGLTTDTIYYITNDDLADGTVLDFIGGGTFSFCFARGTQIATPAGEQSVETLSIGDTVRTADGRDVAVKWIGKQTIATRFAKEKGQPVRVSAGALGNGLPHTDLVLTADHALIIDGLAITAAALVNGTTITLEPLSALADYNTYYHVETEEHDVILANGAPAETLVDADTRRAFDNHAEYVELYGEDTVVREMALPRITSERLVPASIRARLAASVAA